MKRVLQIVPRVPPAVCGVAEYAWNLATALRSRQEIENLFLAAGTGYVEPDAGAEHEVRRLEPRTTASLRRFVSGQGTSIHGIVLHLSAYGFAPRGAPVWLALAMRRIGAMKSRPALVTMFHETYATGSWRTSAFWLRPVQQWVMREIARASDVVRTHREGYARWIESAVAGLKSPVRVMPVFSNFGEPASPSPLAQRAPQMIVFSTGLAAGAPAETVRDRAVELCRKLGLGALHLIGRHWPESGTSGGVAVTRHAFLPADEIAALIADCRAGYMAYPADYLGKSTFFAALAAHGLAVFTQGTQPVLPDGLRDGQEVLHDHVCLGGAPPSTDELQTVADGLRRWYADHDLAANARSYAEDLRACATACAS